MGEPEERKRLRFTDTAPPAVDRRMAGELDEAGLVRMQRERELLQPPPQVRQKASGLGLVFEADDDIIGIAHDDDVTLGMALALPSWPPLPRLPSPPAFSHLRIRRIARRSPIRLIHKTDQPVMAERVEEPGDIGVQYPVHLGAGNPDRERVQARVVLGASGHA